MELSFEEFEKLKYPIGQFEKPESISQNMIALWVNDISLFPLKMKQCLKEATSVQLSWKYRPEGWTIKQLVHHCADSHMNAFIRFKLALTEDSPTIKPYDEDQWANLADGNMDDVQVSLNLLSGLHARWEALLKSLSEEDLKKTFTHPEHGRKIALDENTGLYAWHCNHHLAHVKQALYCEGKY